MPKGAPRPGPCAVYRHYDAGNVLLYVGSSVAPWTRFLQHRCNTEWATRSVRMTMEWLSDKATAEAAEQAAIHAEAPLFNAADLIGQRERQGWSSGNPACLALAEWLNASLLSQGDLADRLGIDFTYVSKIIKGTRRPSVVVAERLARITGGAVPVALWPGLARSGPDTSRDGAVLGLVRDGLADAEIARALDITAPTVVAIRHRLGVARNRIRKRSKHEAALREMAARGLNKSEAARELGIASPTVVRLSQEFGIKFVDGRSHASGKVGTLTASRVERLRNLAAEGLTVTEAARRLGLPQPTVSHLKAKHGIEFHTVHRNQWSGPRS